RVIRFNVIPRSMSGKEWTIIEKGLKQRVRALNMFLRDIYHGREVLRANIIPDDLIFQNPVFRPEMNGQQVPHDVYVHIAGIDIIRVDAEDFIVLEDNARTPSGVSYMLENREIMMRLFPDLFARHRVAPVERYPDELLSAPGLMSAYAAGNITLANAVGTGIADDKAIYSYMPEIVKFYLGEEPILKNVQTWRCREPKDLAYVLDNLSELVVKEVHGSGGYGMLIGPAATKATIEAFRDKLKREPEGFIAQPTLALSTCPTCTESGLAPRHVDLRPFVLTGK